MRGVTHPAGAAAFRPLLRPLLDSVSIISAVRFVLTQPMPLGCAGDSFLERSRSLIVRYSQVLTD